MPDLGAELLARFDGIEVEGMTYCYDQALNSRGIPPMEAAENDDEAAVWSVFGHLPEGGRECLCDCESRELADALASVLQAHITIVQRLEGVA